MNKMALSVDCILSQAQKRVEELQNVIDCLKKQLSKAPDGVLYGSRSHSKWQWQRLLGTKRTYLSGDKARLIKALAQKKYNTLVLKDFIRQRDVLDAFIKAYLPQNGENTYSMMACEWRRMIDPLEFPDAEFAEMWQKQPYKGKSIDNANFVTAKGECVRSKSEIIIADVLNRLGVPYRYEFPHELVLEDSRSLKIYSDFTCLNVRARKEFVWEHFGMMDDAEYARNAMEKLEMYERNGYFLGENLIISMETREKPLNSKSVTLLVKRYLI